MFVAHVVRFAQPRCERFVVVRQLGEHVQWLDVFSIVIEHSLSTRDLSDRMQGEAPDLANAFRDDVGHGEELLGVFIEKQMIIAEVMPAHMPMKIFRFQIQREHVIWPDFGRRVSLFSFLKIAHHSMATSGARETLRCPERDNNASLFQGSAA
jgi:hypothetical protein